MESMDTWMRILLLRRRQDVTSCGKRYPAAAIMTYDEISLGNCRLHDIRRFRANGTLLQSMMRINLAMVFRCNIVYMYEIVCH